jgi:hypothetical protein
MAKIEFLGLGEMGPDAVRSAASRLREGTTLARGEKS